MVLISLFIKTAWEYLITGNYIKYFRSVTLINHDVFEIRFLMNMICIKKIDAKTMPTQTYFLLYCETSFLFVASFFECFVASKALK